MLTYQQRFHEYFQPDPTANLTFNLTLTEREKTARASVPLPYTYDKEKYVLNQTSRDFLGGVDWILENPMINVLGWFFNME